MTALVLRSNVYTISGTKVSDLPKNTTVAEFLKNVVVDAGVKVTIKNGETVLGDSDIVKGGATIVLSYEGMEDVIYTVIASSDKELKDSYYEVKGTTMNVPYTDKNPTTVKEMKNNITVADTATVSVLNGGTELADKDAVAAGMTLRITAEDGTTNDYTIGQKNTYNWTLDYVNGQQGNVWFGQMKNGTGSWANMTEVDRDGWPNWCVNTYYGPGIDGQQGTVSTTDATVHGLLSAPPNTSITTAMAYRVPKSGTVSFNIKGDEPYLRQNGNSGGTVTLSLLLNDTELQSVTLTNSRVQATDWKSFDEIEVSQGDVIRVTTKSNSNPTKPSVHVTPIISYVDKAAADTEAPTAPAAVTATDVTETTAKVTWDEASDNVGVVGYNVYVNENKVNDELVTGTEYDLTGLAEETEYTVTVTAVDAAGNESARSEAATFTTEKAKDMEAPTVPSGVTVTDITETRATVSWEASTDNVEVAGYNVYVNDTKVNAAPVTGTTYDLTGLTEETEYTVTVTAVDTSENESVRSEAATFTTLKTEDPKDTEAPTVPANVRTSDVTETTAKVAWDEASDNVGVVGYNVYVNETKVNDELVTGTEYDLTGLTEETEYTVNVTAVDAEGNESVRSEAVTFTTLKTEEPADTEAPTVPANVKASEITYTKATIAWEASTDNVEVAGYNVYVNNTKVNASLVANPTYDLTGLTEGTEYTVTVTAVDAAGNESEPSEAVTFTTEKETVDPDPEPEPIVVDKTALKENVAKADTALAATDKYTEDSLKKLQDVYTQYAGVLNAEDATQEQVNEANKAIKEALSALEEKKADDSKKDDEKKDDTKKDDNQTTTPSDTSKNNNNTTTKGNSTGTGRTNTGSTGAGSTGAGSTKTGTSTTAVKTGDATNVAGWGFALAASAIAAAAGVAGKRKKED